MTMRRSFRRHHRREALSEATRHYLECGEVRGDASLSDVLAARSASLRGLWRDFAAEVLSPWISAHPGRRPWAWWRVAAPEPRRRLGGVGDPAHEHLALEPVCDFGIPRHWVTVWQVAYYNGHARDIHGQPIGTEFHEGDFRGVAIDPRDPPVYEGEAAYLARDALLSDAERAQLTAADFDAHEVVKGREGPLQVMGPRPVRCGRADVKGQPRVGERAQPAIDPPQPPRYR
jgi:hypothetical protein